MKKEKVKLANTFSFVGQPPSHPIYGGKAHGMSAEWCNKSCICQGSATLPTFTRLHPPVLIYAVGEEK